jgi:hypothetical protein
MDRNKIKERLELALRPVEKPPTLEEALEQVSRHGVLRGPVDWVFPAWMLYVEYATQKITETFPLTEEEKRQLLDFRDAMKRLLREAWTQAEEKLTALHKAVAEGTYRLEGNKLYAPDGTWMYVGRTVYIPIHGISASTRFPDVLKLPLERLELLQLGWRASDEGENGRPLMGTTQPWQVFAWAAARYGKLYIRVDSVNLTREGVSVLVSLRANSWKQRWDKDEAISLVADHLRRGEWAPIITAWLGDGQTDRKKVLRGDYQLVITAKEPWRLGISIGTGKALVATGKEAFVKLKEAAGTYGALLDLLRIHKWIYIKLATDDGFRATYKLKKRGIDVLREAYGRNSGEIPTEFSQAEEPRRGAVVVAGVVMYLHLANGSLLAKRYVRDVEKALAIAERLELVGLSPNVVRSGTKYMVYIATADLLRLAERDEAVRRAIARYLTEKMRSGTLRQKEIAKKLLKNPLFSNLLTSFFCFFEVGAVDIKICSDSNSLKKAVEDDVKKNRNVKCAAGVLRLWPTLQLSLCMDPRQRRNEPGGSGALQPHGAPEPPIGQ